MRKFAVLQLSGCAGCEVSLLDSEAWINRYKLEYMPLVISSHDVPEVDVLLISGGVRTEQDLYNLRRAVKSAPEVVAVGTCAISGGVASLGDRKELRKLFLEEHRPYKVPHLLPECRPVDAFVNVDRYLPGCPPTPELFMRVISGEEYPPNNKVLCLECGRKKKKEVRPSKLAGFRQGEVDSDLCLVKAGFLCIGSSTRSGCGAICPKAGFPCVGCRGPADGFIGKDSASWFESIKKVFHALTDIPDEEIDAGLRSAQMSLFLFQFSDYAEDGAARPKEKMV